MHPNAELINRFYESFAGGDHATMARSYADDATFSDPVFPRLDAGGVRAMWRMFCTGGNDIDVTFRDIVADDTSGTAHWEAVYRFPATGKQVHNRIDAAFTFRDGRIERHVDTFDFYAWSKQALGPVGMLLGWSPIVKNKVRAQAGAQLDKFRSREAEAG